MEKVSRELVDQALLDFGILPKFPGGQMKYSDTLYHAIDRMCSNHGVSNPRALLDALCLSGVTEYQTEYLLLKHAQAENGKMTFSVLFPCADGKLADFTITEPINQSSFIAHLEQALYHIHAQYVAMQVPIPMVGSFTDIGPEYADAVKLLKLDRNYTLRLFLHNANVEIDQYERRH